MPLPSIYRQFFLPSPQKENLREQNRQIASSFIYQHVCGTFILIKLMRATNAFVLTLLCLLGIGLGAGLKIYSVSSKPDVVENPPISSWRGGTMIYLKVLGHSLMASGNQIYVGTLPCIIPSDGVSDTYIACETTDSGVDQDIDNLPVTIISDGASYSTWYPNSVYYRDYRTPYITEIFPSSGLAYSKINLWGYHRITNFGDGQRDMGDVIKIMLGNDLCNRFDIDPPIVDYTWQAAFINCSQSHLMEAGNYNVTEQTVPGFAKKATYIRRSSLKAGEYYEYTALPTVTGVNTHRGNHGGQSLSISGTGFSLNKNNNTVEVDGTTCKVSYSDEGNIQCILAAKNNTLSTKLTSNSSNQTNGYFSGAGIRYARYNYTDNFDNFVTAVRSNNLTTLGQPLEVGFRTQLREGDTYGSYYCQTWNGYFTAPVTGDYTFIGTSDDYFRFYLANVTGSTELPASALISSDGYQQWNDFYMINRPNAVATVTLQKDMSYYFEAYHINGYGRGHFRIEVSVPNTDTSLSFQTYQVDEIFLNQTLQPEVVVYTMKGGSGTFNIRVYRPASGQTPAYDVNVDVAYNCATTTFRDALNKFDYFSSYAISVDKVFYTADGNTTSNIAIADRIEYTVTIRKLRPTDYVTKTFLYNAKNYTGTFIQPTNSLSNHSPLISGSFTLTIGGVLVDPYGNGTLNYDTSPSEIQKFIRSRIVGFQDVEVSWSYSYGCEYSCSRWIKYKNYNNQTSVVVGTSGLTGGLGLPSIAVNTKRNYSSNVLFNPIDYRFLSIPSNTPNVIVKTNGIPSICTGDCSYSFALYSQVTSLSINGTVLSFAISDPTLKNFTANDVKVNVQGKTCTVDTNQSISALTCQLPVAGNGSLALVASSSVTPIVWVRDYGIAGLANGVSPFAVPLVVNAPTANGGTNGGYYISLTGKGFPTNIDDISITLCSAKAAIKSTTSTQVDFYVPKCNTNGSQTITVKVGGITDTNQSFTYTDPVNAPTIMSISPTSANPGIKGTLDINGQGFGNDSSLLRVFLSNSTGKAYQLRVINSTSTYIKAGLPGGVAGTFTVEVNLPSVGDSVLAVNGSNTFKYQVSVSSVSPASGSYYGGTLLTITGQNFATEPQQTLVFVGITVNWMCSIQAITATSILCRTPAISEDYNPGDPQPIVVTTRLIVLSECVGGCNFTYMPANTSPTLTNLTYNETLKVVTLDGTNFLYNSACSITFTNTMTKAITVFTPVSSTNIFANITIPATLISGEYTVKIRNDAGESNGMSVKIKWVPGSANIYSSGLAGARVTISGGAGYPLDLTNKQFSIDIKDPQGITTPANVVSCCSGNSIVLEMPPGVDSATYKVYFNGPVGSARYDYSSWGKNTGNLTLNSSSVVAPGINNINLTLLQSINNPIVSVSLVSVKSPLHTIPVNVAGVVKNGTSITFSVNVPAGCYKFRIRGAITYYSINNILNVTMPVNVYTTAQTYSYNGGLYTVNASGLSPASNIRVNGLRGDIVSYDTTTNIATYQLPPLLTPQTQTNYSLAKPVRLDISTATLFSDIAINSNVWQTFDGSLSSFYSSTNSSCWIGVDFGSGVGASVSRIRFFSNFDWDNTAKKILGATFEGSNNGNNWTILATVDQTVHSGWNTLVSTITTPYRYVRFSHTSESQCSIAEIEFYGILFSTSVVNPSSQLSDVVYEDGFNSITLTPKITYTSAKTAIVTAFSPKYGDIKGGYTLTLTGKNFFTPPTVFIDGIECINATFDNTTGTTATCIVGARSQFPSKNSIVVKFGDNNAILRATFYYVLKWSDKETWGVDLPPIDGDLVSVPAGMTLLVDQDTPNLKGIAVANGTIIFSDERDLTINTGFITLVGGRFIAGTEQTPHQHKLNFILHGDYYDTQMPMFGNKGIGCMECSFSMYGRPRTPTWTTISATISPGDLDFTVAQDVDWQIGEEIVVASTSFYHWEAERRRIVSITGNRTITVDSAFVYRHVYAIQTYGTSDLLPMIAQVGLLTRNIKMRGDDATTMVKEYGSHLMIMGQAVNGAEGHIAYSQFTQCGQPAILGRYCIHFHMMGDVPTSYVRGNAVHDSLARVVTIHGVHYLLVENNVGYRVRGHNFFVEDGIETHNIIRNNLAIGSLVASNMLQTDTSVASFWVTNPSNDFYGNHAAGSDFYGIWYEIKPEPDGPSATNDVCPIGNPLGSVHDNVAHSNVRFGLRIFKLQSRKYPCDPIRDDKNGTDPWYSNPSITSQFSNFVLYKNMEDGLLAEQTGNVVFQNFSIGESYHSGVEFYLANFTRQPPLVTNSFIVGQSRTNAAANKTNYTLGMSGAITGRSGVTKLDNIRFYSFPTGSILLQTCRLCDDPLKYTNLGTEVILSKLTFTDINGSLLNMIGMQRDVIYDLDGSLSYAFDGKNRTSATIVHGFPHIALSNSVLCPQALNPASWDNAVMCGPTASVRRVYFTNLQKHQDFATQYLKASELASINDSVPIHLNQTNYTAVASLLAGTVMQPKMELAHSWSLPFITGRIYNIWWGSGIDFNHLSVVTSPSYTAAEKGIIFKFNYSQNRERFQIGPMVGGAALVKANFVPKTKTYLDPSTCLNGDYYHDNSDNTSLRMLNLCQSGKNKTLFEYTEINGIVCDLSCPAPPGTYVLENFLRYWSNATQWPGGKVPQAGDNVTVKGEWRLVLDMDPHPINNLTIDGILIADDTMDITIIANFIQIRAGNLTAGSPTKPFLHKLSIQLNGAKTDTPQVIDPLLTGNKLFVVTGGLNLYGSPPSTVIATLTETVFKGSNTIKVDSYTDWKAGDMITLAPSFSLYSEYETATIQSIDNTTGYITLTAALLYTHYGAEAQTITSIYGNLDTRAKVGHVSRNIKIFAGPDSGWGFSIYVYGYTDKFGVSYIGSTQLIGVQILDGGQLDSTNSPLVFKNLVGSNRTSRVFGSSFVNCKAFCINVDTVTNVSISNNVLYNAWVFAVQAKAMKHFSFTNNVIIGVDARPTVDPSIELVACYSTYTYVNATTDYVKVTDNFCQGSVGHGWAVPHVACDQMQINPFANNTIGSARIGFIVNTIVRECQAFSYVKAYACTIGHILGSPNSKTVLLSNFIVADNERGLTLKLGASEGKNNHTAYLTNSYVTPISRPDCSYCYGSGKIDCTGVHGIRMFTASANGEVMPGKFGDGFDVICKQPVFDSKAYLTNVIFDNFKQSYNNTAVASTCGNNFVFRPNGAAFDMVGGHFLTNCNCTNCDKDSYVLCDAPDPKHLGWFGGCGDILCTGKNNYQVVDWTGGFLGTPGTIIGNNSLIGDNEANCTFSKSMNGHICKRTDFGTLQYQSIAPDFNKRIMWPVNLTYDGANYTTMTNGWREWQWLGKQPQNLRFGRFVSVVRYFQSYNMTFSAIPPHNLQLQLQKRTPNGNNSNYIIVRIYYPLPNSLRLTVNNKVVKPGVLTDYNNATSLLNNLNRSQCGSNIYFYANTTITFVLTEDPDCTAVISVVDSISLTTHFAVDINTFFSSNAISSFINNLCAILKITDTSRVKVVGVYSGSTIVNTVIEAESTTGNTTVSNSSTTSNASSLTEINNLLNSNINSGVFASTMASIAPVQAVVALVNYVDNGSGKDQESQQRKNKALIIGVSVGGGVVVAVISMAVMHIMRKRAKVMDDLANDDQMHQEKNPDLYDKSAHPQHSEGIMSHERSPAFEAKHLE